MMNRSIIIRWIVGLLLLWILRSCPLICDAFVPRIAQQRQHLLPSSWATLSPSQQQRRRQQQEQQPRRKKIKQKQCLLAAEEVIPFTARNESISSASAEASGTNYDSGSPSYRDLIVFTGTTILIWLSEPLLSLVDTTVVAWTQPKESAVIQLAALGPATTLYDSLLYGTYFLAISTTNLIAKYRALNNYHKLQQTARQVLGVAVVLGTIVMTIMAIAGAPILRNMAGTAASPQLLFHATRYTYIRTTVAIASVISMVSQSFCLATLDTVTPARAVALSSVINLAGDLLLSPKWGVQGAAVATAAATLASTTILLRAVKRQLKQWSILEQQQEYERQQSTRTSTNSDNNNNKKFYIDSHKDENNNNSKNNNKNEASFLGLFALPGVRDGMQLVTLAGPILFVIWAKVACYSAMTLKCTQFGVTAMAAQSILMRVFFFFSSFGDSVAQAAQSFLPATLVSSTETARRQFQTLFRKLFVIAATIGIVNSQVSVLILKHLGKLLTSDVQIIQLMKDQTVCFGLSLLLHPIIIMLEGTVIASQDFGTLVGTYVMTLVLHFSILKTQVTTFPAVWKALLLFQAIRLSNFSIRVWQRQAQFQKQQQQQEKQQQ